MIIITILAIIACLALAIAFVSEMDKMKPNYIKSAIYGAGIFIVIGIIRLVCS